MPEEKGEDITPQKDGGVLKTIIKEGTGKGTPPAGQKVKVHYTGTLLDGTEFDSSRSRDPFEFSLGKGSVIKAWDIAVATMTEGEICKIVCREDYAYGKNGFPPKIPAEATLVFEIEMLGWEGEDLSSKKDKGIVKNPITPGTGFDSPSDCSLVDVKLVGECEGRVFDERTVQFNLGEGADINIPYGVEKALEKMVLKETSRIDLKPTYAFGPEGSKTFNIPPNTNVSYTLTLNNFEKAKEVWLLDAAELLEQSKLYKEKGGNYFKQEKFTLALKMYKKMLEYLKNDKDFVDESETERKTLLLAGHLNVSMCHLKLKNHLAAKNECDEVLQLDSNNVKALFRRGQALLSMNEPSLAIGDFEKVVSLESGNKAAAAQIVVCKQKMKEIRSKEKQMYANMFEKFAQKDREVTS